MTLRELLLNFGRAGRISLGQSHRQQDLTGPGIESTVVI